MTDERDMNSTSRQAPAEQNARKGVRGWLADVAAAFALLSIVPLPARWRCGAAWPRALRALPLAGAGVGLASALALAGAHVLLPDVPAAAVLLGLLAGIIFSGALHEDGLADVADALGGRSRQRRLEIMRDARIGAFGVLALIFAISLQASALLALMAQGWARAFFALVLAHAGSRLAVVWLMHALPHARKDGMSVAAGRPGPGVLAQAALVVLAVAALCLPWLEAGALLTALLAGAGVAAGMTALLRRLLGGQTGDAAGATEVITRTALLLALAA